MEALEKVLSKGKSKQKIEENNGDVCIKKSFNLKIPLIIPLFIHK